MPTLTAAKKQHARRAPRRWSAQLQKYHLQWRRIFEKFGWGHKPENEKRALRHSILEDLFGCEINVNDATETQWDAIYLAQDILLENGIIVWGPEMARYALEEGTRNRYVWNIERAGYDIPGIEEYGVPEEYISAISADKFGVRDWRSLSSKKLWQLFITIKNRVRKAGGIRKFADKAIVNADDPF